MPEGKKPGVCKMVPLKAEPPPAPPEIADYEVMGREEMLATPAGGGLHLVPVPEWGDKKAVLLREWTGRERDAFEGQQAGRKEAERFVNFRARLVAATACDGAGNLLFTEADAEALGAKSARVLDRLFEASARLNALSPRDVEVMGKNSGGVPSGSSGSASPSA